LDDLLRLIRRTKNGDRDAADALVWKYYDEVYRFVSKQTSDGEIARDLTQEIFISLLKTIGRYDPKKGAGFRTWLYKIGTDKIIDYFRSRVTHTCETLSLDEIEPINIRDFTQEVENKELAESIRVYVNGFPPDSQKIFRLHIYGCYTFAEIAEILHMPEGSVKSKYYRLLSKIREKFND